MLIAKWLSGEIDKTHTYKVSIFLLCPPHHMRMTPHRDVVMESNIVDSRHNFFSTIKSTSVFALGHRRPMESHFPKAFFTVKSIIVCAFLWRRLKDLADNRDLCLV